MKNYYPVDVPNGKSGDWAVEEFYLTEQDVRLDNLRAIRNRLWECVASPGRYKRLTRGPIVVMSNTQLEYYTNRSFIDKAVGNILITGLGLGMILRPLVRRKEVATITVVEQSPDVIKLVAPTYQDLVDKGKLHLVLADALQWKPTIKYQMAWHDIWNDFGPGHLAEYARIKAHYRSKVTNQECWAENLSRRMARQERTYHHA